MSSFIRYLRRFGGLTAAWLILHAGAFGQEVTAPVKTSTPCLPWLKWFTEGPPKLKFRKARPKPVCKPCHLPQYGYHAACWRPWISPEEPQTAAPPLPAEKLPPPAVPTSLPSAALPEPIQQCSHTALASEALNSIPSGLSQSASQNLAPRTPPASSPVSAVEEGLRLVNSRRIVLDYDLSEQNSSRGSLELWSTMDGKNWRLHSTALMQGSSQTVEVDQDGTFGFTLLARPAGQPAVPPPPSEVPQVWIEVDTTGPDVRLTEIGPGLTAHGRSLAIHWVASDRNLAQRPIRLAWAEQPVGPWQLIADNLHNTGRFVWHVPVAAPGEVYLRVEARDRAGNTGSATSPVPVSTGQR